MQIEYLRTAKKSYMIVKEADFPSPEYEGKMIRQNEIPCLLPFQPIRTDGVVEYWYDVSGRQSLKTLFSLESLGAERLCFLLENLMEMKAAMEEYLLDDANIWFSAETIWIDRTPERMRFCYVPGFGAAGTLEIGTGGLAGSDTPGLQHLFEEILQSLNHADPIAVRIGYEMYERCAHGSFDMADCADCLRMGTVIAEATPESMASAPISPTASADTPIPDTEAECLEDLEFLFEGTHRKDGHQRRKRKEPDKGQRRGANWNQGIAWAKDKWNRLRHEEEPEEDELLFALRPDLEGDSARTELLSVQKAERTWHLAYKGTGMESDLALTTSPFLVGTDRNRVSGVLLARTVSHVHARLELREGRLYVEDFNSTNGTYVNHTLLPMHTPTELTEGDRIVFATEEYEVFRR